MEAATKRSRRRLRVKQVSPGVWGLFEEDGTPLLPAKSFETPARALSVACSYLSVEALLEAVKP
jgi:hypothetical protein